MLGGWFEAAYERELDGDLTPVHVGDTPLALVRGADSIRAVDAVCPHRGANLGFGGRLEGKVVICPFHGHRIALGTKSSERYRVREFPVLGYGGMIFVRLSENHDSGLSEYLEDVSREHVFVPGYSLSVRCRPELVIENAFDSSHFRPVHDISNEPEFARQPSEHDQFVVSGWFEFGHTDPHSPGGGATRVLFVARAFSPYLVIAEFQGELPYLVITGATPANGGGCIVRVSLAMPKGPDGAGPDPGLCRYLLDHSKQGIESDAVIWEHLTELPRPGYAKQDTSVIEFARFCARFRA